MVTLDDVKTINRDYLIPREVAAVLGASEQSIRVWARQCPERLGFNICVIGTRVKIPRLAFIRWLEGKE